MKVRLWDKKLIYWVSQHYQPACKANQTKYVSKVSYANNGLYLSASARRIDKIL